MILPLYYIINTFKFYINPLNAKLNPICHFLALLGAHHIRHVSRIRVKWYIFTTKPHLNYHLLFGDFDTFVNTIKHIFWSTNCNNNSPFVSQLLFKYQFYRPIICCASYFKLTQKSKVLFDFLRRNILRSNHLFMVCRWIATAYLVWQFWCRSVYAVHTDAILNEDKLLNTRYYRLMK